MTNTPSIGKFLDREEEELFRAIESDDYVLGKSTLTPLRKAELQHAARNTLNDERVQITLRVPNTICQNSRPAHCGKACPTKR